MSFLESLWDDLDSDDLLFEDFTRVIDADHSAFDAGHGLGFTSKSSDRYSMEHDNVERRSIVLDHGYASEDKQLARAYPSAKQDSPNAGDMQQHAEPTVTCDSSERRDRSVLGLNSHILDIITRPSNICPAWC